MKISSPPFILILISILILITPISPTPFSFNFPNFPPQTTEISYEGDATISNGAIRLIPSSSYSRFRVGRASFHTPFHLHDSSTGIISSFTTNFNFTIDIFNLSTLTDGFAFFLVPVSYPIPPNSAGRGLGLFNSTTRSNPIVVVEFDTFANSFDPPFSHIGINNGSISSSAVVEWDLRETSGKEGRVSILYNASEKNLSVCCRYGEDRVFNVWYVIDLREVLPDWVRVGFSAASGRFCEKNFAIQSWKFDSDLDFEDVFGSENVVRKKTVVVIGVASLFVLVLAGGLGWFRVRKRNGRGSYALVSRDLERGTFPKRFTFEELEMATDSFADHMKLGHGGSGCGDVYRGRLSDIPRLVAVKKISVEAVDSEKIFINEVKP
ncbi:Lectin [Euphorbia peplus]|nr:Lectin [Euphorbia peplus]